MRVTTRLRDWAHTVKRDAIALSIAARDKRVPWYAKAVAIMTAAYALSPIDLVPDFVPVLGYLDDVVIVPAGIALAVHLIPPDLMEEFRVEAAKRDQQPRSIVAAVVIVLLWAASLALLAHWLWRRAHPAT